MESRYGQMFLRSIAGDVERCLSDFKPDALLTSWAHPDGWAALQIGRRYGIPVTLKVVGSDLLVLSKRPRRLPWIRQTLAGVDHVVAVSRHLADRAIALGANPERTSVVFEGVNERLFCPGSKQLARQTLSIPDTQQTLLFVGNMLMSKGAGVLVEAMAKLRAKGSNARCYMIGAGRDRERVMSDIARLNLSGAVTLVNACPYEKLPNWYGAADLIVLPSFSEGIPNVLREALMCGRPYVATAVGGIPEITDPSYGLLTPPGDATALADAIETAMKADLQVDPNLARRHNISWEESARQLAGCIESTLIGRVPYNGVARQ